MKLLVAGCSMALLLTGCGKENNETNTLTNTTVETSTETVDEEAEETVEEEVEKEAAPETEEPKEETSEETADNKEEETENEDEVSGEESSTLDEEKEESNTQNDSSSSQTSNSTENSNSGNSSNNNSSSSGSSNSSGNSNTGSSGSSTTGNTSTGNNTTAPHTHTYDAGAITKYANCTTTGIKTYTCSCGNTYTETIPVTAHTYSNGSCTVCGTADPNYVAAYTYDVYLETGMLGLVNTRRGNLGYAGLTWDSSMDETAKVRARKLADWFGHEGTGYTELITGGGGNIGLSTLHNNYVNSTAHDRELHQNTYAYFSSATCVVKDSNGNITATYNVVLLRSAQSEGGSSQNMEDSGIIDPNPPGDDDIIW